MNTFTFKVYCNLTFDLQLLKLTDLFSTFFMYIIKGKNYFFFFTRALFRFPHPKIAPLNYFAVAILELRGGFFFF